MNEPEKSNNSNLLHNGIALWLGEISSTFARLTARPPRMLLHLLLIVGAFGVFIFLRTTNMPLDDIQYMLYVVFLFGLAGLTSPIASTPARLCLVLFLLGAPLTSALNIRGFLPASPSYRGGVIARLSDSTPNIESRNLLFKVNEVNYLYDIPTLTMIQRIFGTAKEAHEWVTKRPSTAFLLWGPGAKPNLELQNASLLSSSFIPTHLTKSITRCQLGTYKNALALSINELVPVELCFITAPERFTVTLDDMELGRHFLAFFSQGLNRLTTKMDSVPQSYKAAPYEWLRLPFAQASEIFGPWSSYSAPGAAHFFAANTELLGALSEEDPSPSQLECALVGYRSAVTRARDTGSPELIAAIFNNAAIAILLKASDPQDFEKSKNWFIRAAGEKTPSGERTAGALAALENLHFLTSSGFL